MHGCGMSRLKNENLKMVTLGNKNVSQSEFVGKRFCFQEKKNICFHNNTLDLGKTEKHDVSRSDVSSRRFLLHSGVMKVVNVKLPNLRTFSLAKTAFPNAKIELSGTCSAKAITSKIKTRSRSDS